MSKSRLPTLPTPPTPTIENGNSVDGEKPISERGGNKPYYKLQGKSILEYAKRDIDNSKVLLGGNGRWLERQNGAFVVGPSGVGKSTFVIQASILWACNKEAFGIKPNGSLRLLIVQSEDDDNDITEMARMIDHSNLSSADKELVGKNTHVEFVNDSWGQKFLTRLEDYINQYRPDIVFINPYSAFVGGKGLMDEESNVDFLRHGLNRLLIEYDCAAILVHHTPKTHSRNTDDWDVIDYSYSAAGWAVLTNWARAVLVIDPADQKVSPGVFKFVAAKRGERIGWATKVKYFSHSPLRMQWIPSTQVEITKVKMRGDPESLLPLIPRDKPITQGELWIEAKKELNLGENRARKYKDYLLNRGMIFQWEIKQEKKNSKVGYAQTAQE
jgi:hypothetical protein